MTAAGEEWILLSEALALTAPNWRTGFGLLGGGDRERILRWLADERLAARADEVVEYVVVEPEPSTPPTLTASSSEPPTEPGEQITYRTAPAGSPISRSQWPLSRIERCHIHIPPEVFSYHDLRQHSMWEDDELTIWVMDGTEARTIFYDIRVEKNLLLSRAGLNGRPDPQTRKIPTPPAAELPAAVTPDLPKGRRLSIAQWDQWVDQYKRDHPVLPDVDRKIYREAKETFGGAVTQAMCRDAFGGNKPGPR